MCLVESMKIKVHSIYIEFLSLQIFFLFDSNSGLQPRYRDEYLRERNDARRGIWISLMPHLEYCPTVLDDLMLSTNNVRPQELDLY